MTKALPKLTLRPETKTQIDRHRKAAKAMRRSLNFFYLEAGDKLAAEILTSEKSEQLMAPVRATDS